MTQIIKTSRSYNLISACFAFLLWGGWSFYINTQQGSLKHGIISGLIQGICSFVITLFMTFIIDQQFNYFKNLTAKLLLPPILTVLCTGSLLILIHHLIGTPSILYTLSPILTVAFLFAIFTNFKLYQHYKQYQMP
ncbi:hypothetical protein [Acinetobacter silvestris]|uniref:Uncharacterized protein n=1 Tax=Acinetobacter silvestris TaxID=1977882 RepID=A0A1Y3CJ98_9GAMM|nr:hypothetical protein [Acinetobacter silvestris]OTG67190.1 hypothetical protein B9T28_00690 [Acinetobacter silvestris]